MPNTTSAKKALRQNIVRRARNKAQRSALRTLLKKARAAAEESNPGDITALSRQVSKKLDQAAAKNLIHKNKAARLKSRFAHLVAKSAAAKAAAPAAGTNA